MRARPSRKARFSSWSDRLVRVHAASRNAMWLTLCLAAAGCKTDAASAGERCTRSAQCEAGLACIEGRCSNDLDALQGQSTVPMLMPDEPAEEPQPPGAGEPGPTPAEDAG